MNILQVVESCNAGVGRYVADLCRSLAALGHQVTVAYSPRRTDPAFREFVSNRRKGIRFVALDVGRKVSPISDLGGVLRLTRLMRSESPSFDVVHGHSSKGGALARMAGHLSSTPTVYTPNGLIMASPEISKAEAAIYILVERILGRWATSRFVAVSEDERELVFRLGLVVPQSAVVLVENGIDDQVFDSVTSPDSLEGLETKPLTIGSVMRFSAQKAPGDLVRAFVQLNEALPGLPMKLVIVGDGELFAETRTQVKASGLGEKIHLLGWRTDFREVLREFDIFVLPSRYEGFSYMILEAMAAKLPVVTTNVFGTRETVARVPGNIVVSVGDSAALALGMKRMATLAVPEILRQALYEIGQANHDYARRRFSQSEITRRTLEVYRAVC